MSTSATTTLRALVTASGELIGTLTHVKTPDGHSETYHYDVGTGRLLGVDEQVAGSGGGNFSATFGYNSDGLVTDIGYPTTPGLAPVAVHHGYDGHGHLTSLQDLSKAIVPLGTFWSVTPATATNDYDQLQAETFGNGVSTTRSYTANGSVEDIESTINGATV